MRDAAVVGVVLRVARCARGLRVIPRRIFPSPCSKTPPHKDLGIFESLIISDVDDRMISPQVISNFKPEEHEENETATRYSIIAATSEYNCHYRAYIITRIALIQLSS